MCRWTVLAYYRYCRLTQMFMCFSVYSSITHSMTEWSIIMWHNEICCMWVLKVSVGKGKLPYISDDQTCLQVLLQEAIPDFPKGCFFSFISFDWIQGFIQCFTWESKAHSKKGFIKHRAGFHWRQRQKTPCQKNHQVRRFCFPTLDRNSYIQSFRLTSHRHPPSPRTAYIPDKIFPMRNSQ